MDTKASELLRLLDSIASLNGGPVTINGFPYIAIRREDWEALLKHRGTPEEVLARLDGAPA